MIEYRKINIQGFGENTSKGRDLSQGGVCCPFLTQNAFSIARFDPPELIPVRCCGENDRIDRF